MFTIGTLLHSKPDQGATHRHNRVFHSSTHLNKTVDRLGPENWECSRLSVRSIRAVLHRTVGNDRRWLALLRGFSRGAGPRTCEVRVKIGAKDLTSSLCSFEFFANSSASCCLAVGPGLLTEGAPGIQTSFFIEARNAQNGKRTTGGDNFIVKAFMLLEASHSISKLLQRQKRVHSDTCKSLLGKCQVLISRLCNALLRAGAARELSATVYRWGRGRREA